MIQPLRDQVEKLLLLGTSMGGARPKAVVEDRDGLWVAKFGRNDDRWNYVRVEYGMLRLAPACGLNVAESRVETAGGRGVLLVRRFDRDRSDAGYRRHRMESALTLLCMVDRTGDSSDWSYPLFADEVRRCSGDSESDLRELFGRMCFDAAVSNLDDNPRNHATLARGRRWRISPAFDLTPGPAVSRERRDPGLACGRFGRYANRTNLMGGHSRFLLSRAQAETLFERITGTLGQRWHTEMRLAGVSEFDCKVIRVGIPF